MRKRVSYEALMRRIARLRLLIDLRAIGGHTAKPRRPKRVCGAPVEDRRERQRRYRAYVRSRRLARGRRRPNRQKTDRRPTAP